MPVNWSLWEGVVRVEAQVLYLITIFPAHLCLVHTDCILYTCQEKSTTPVCSHGIAPCSLRRTPYQPSITTRTTMIAPHQISQRVISAHCIRLRLEDVSAPALFSLVVISASHSVKVCHVDGHVNDHGINHVTLSGPRTIVEDEKLWIHQYRTPPHAEIRVRHGRQFDYSSSVRHSRESLSSLCSTSVLQLGARTLR